MDDRSNLVFVEEPSPSLFCSICKLLLFDPVISVKCGHTFCRLCVESTPSPSEGNDSGSKLPCCPVDKTTFVAEDLVANRAIASQLEDLLIYCRYSAEGQRSQGQHTTNENADECNVKLPLSKLRDHEKSCQYALIICPNFAERCGSIRKKDLDRHLHSCNVVPCIYKHNGCKFIDTKDKVSIHQCTCVYVKKPEVNGNHRDNTTDESIVLEIEALKQENIGLKSHVTVLTQEMTNLKNSHDSLQAQVEKYAACISLNRLVTSLKSKLDDLQIKPIDQQAGQALTGSKSKLTSSNSFTSGHKRKPSFNSSEYTISYHEQWQLPFEFKCIGTLRGHNGAICCLATKGHKLYSSGADKVIKVWDMETLSKGWMHMFKGHTETVRALIDGGKYLYSAGADRSIRSWRYDESNTSEYKCYKNAHDETILALVRAGKFIFSSSQSEIKVWDCETLDLIKTISGLRRAWALTLDPKKESLYSGAENCISIWDATGQFNLKSKVEHEYGLVYCLKVTDKYLIMGTHNRNIQIFDIKTYEHVRALRGHIGMITALALSPRNRFLLSSSYDGTVKIWNLENFLKLQSLSRHEGSINALTLHNGLLFTGSEDKEIKIFKFFKMLTHSSYGIQIEPGKDT
ncbi:E3 ubiquitin-protein ligase TRAF7-like isoform X2 [Anneissia japonica]|uniref:E3 ubiquitin-protein ligase TRAF7-like isoform X2 n=1 Tax=Anneissia japonica TaxID=1529436 RepID=UPI001425604B|nr:E3 ubiquitin-protein ligase TRAF7-like isoform X2 [Anneissia japonica]